MPGSTLDFINMLITVHSQEKPAVDKRAVISAVLLLVFVTGLAAWMTWRRSAGQASPVIAPSEWSISFRPPRGAPTAPLRFGEGIGMRFRTASGATATMTVQRLAAETEPELRSACEHVLRMHFHPLPHRTTMLPMIWNDKKIGTHDAVEVWDPNTNALVRAALAESKEIYAVFFVVQGGPIDSDAYAVFQKLCQSITDRPVKPPRTGARTQKKRNTLLHS